MGLNQPPIGEHSPLRVQTESRPGSLRLLVHGEIDIATVGDLVAGLEVAEASDARSIVLDLSQVSFLDSTGLSALVRGALRSSENGNRLSVVSSPAVDRVVDLCGLRDRLPLT